MKYKIASQNLYDNDHSVWEIDLYKDESEIFADLERNTVKHR